MDKILCMSKEVENTINSIKAELQYNSSNMEQDDALPAAERVYHELLLPIIAAVLDEYDHDLIVIEELAIDLGILREDEIPDRLADMLREKLDSHFAFENNRKQENLISSELSHKETFDEVINYLINETIPWYMEQSEFTPSSWLDSKLLSIEDDSISLDEIILAMRYHHAAFVRVLHECSEYSLSIIASRLLHKYSNLLTEDDLNTRMLDSINETNHRSILIYLISHLINLQSLPALTSTPVDQNALSCFDQLLKETVLHGPVASYLTLSTFSNEQILQVAQFLQGRGLSDDEFNGIVNEDNRYVRILHLTRFIVTTAIGEEASPSILSASFLNDTNTHSQESSTEVLVNDFINLLNSWNAKHTEESVIYQHGGEHEEMLQKILLEEYDSMRSFKDKKIYSETAGLVLVHPFLVYLFDNLKMLDEKHQFKSISAAVHAVHLLNYVAGNTDMTDSHLLVVEKQLCGLPPTFPILGKEVISAEEKEEVESMLQAICQNWPSLSTTSIAGLQHSFLRRFGYVECTPDSCIVHVESSAIDILMDDLPWGVSTILLPWIENVLWVDWQTE